MRTDRLAGGGLLLLGLFVLRESRALPLGSFGTPGPAAMPVVLALLLVAFGALLVALGASSPSVRTLGWTEAPHALAILAAGAFAAFALERLGYRLTMAVTLFLLLRVVERRGMVFAAGLSLALALLTFYVFDTLLRVPLPRGPLGM